MSFSHSTAWILKTRSFINQLYNVILGSAYSLLIVPGLAGMQRFLCADSGAGACQWECCAVLTNYIISYFLNYIPHHWKGTLTHQGWLKTCQNLLCTKADGAVWNVRYIMHPEIHHGFIFMLLLISRRHIFLFSYVAPRWIFIGKLFVLIVGIMVPFKIITFHDNWSLA